MDSSFDTIVVQGAVSWPPHTVSEHVVSTFGTGWPLGARVRVTLLCDKAERPCNRPSGHDGFCSLVSPADGGRAE
jgi:hypothetical protein